MIEELDTLRTRPQLYQVALAYYGKHLSQAEIGREMRVSRERVKYLVGVLKLMFPRLRRAYRGRFSMAM